MRTGFASTPRSRWFIVVFDAMRTRNTRETEMPADFTSPQRAAAAFPLKIASLQPLRAAGLALLNDAVDDIRAVADLAVARRSLWPSACRSLNP